METHEIRYFLAAARELNFTRAAAASNVSQPALTRAIKKLEAELGGQLFLRRGGGVELTHLGRTVIPQLETIERSMAFVREQAQTLAEVRSSSLRLGVMCTVGPFHFADLLARLKVTLPDLEVTLVEATAAAVIDLLVADEVDVGITAWPSYPEAIAVLPLFEERYVVAMPAAHPLANLPSIPLELLADHPYLERLSCEFDGYYEARFGQWTIELDVCYASEREDWIQALILAEQGLAIVPELMRMEDGIVMRPLAQPEIRREVSFVCLRGRRLNDAAQQFQRLVRAHKWSAVRPPRG